MFNYETLYEQCALCAIFGFKLMNNCLLLTFCDDCPNIPEEGIDYLSVNFCGGEECGHALPKISYCDSCEYMPGQNPRTLPDHDYISTINDDSPLFDDSESTISSPCECDICLSGTPCVENAEDLSIFDPESIVPMEPIPDPADAPVASTVFDFFEARSTPAPAIRLYGVQAPSTTMPLAQIEEFNGATFPPTGFGSNFTSFVYDRQNVARHERRRFHRLRPYCNYGRQTIGPNHLLMHRCDRISECRNNDEEAAWSRHISYIDDLVHLRTQLRCQEQVPTRSIPEEIRDEVDGHQSHDFHRAPLEGHTFDFTTGRREIEYFTPDPPRLFTASLNLADGDRLILSGSIVPSRPIINESDDDNSQPEGLVINQRNRLILGPLTIDISQV